MIALSHILFGAIVCLALHLVLRLRGVRSPPKLFYPFTLFMMEFPDVDHFFQEGGKLPRMSQVIPFTFWDLFRWELRTEYFSFTFLHYWAYPFILLVLLAVPLAWPKGTRWIIFGMFLGWTTHLALDGVMLFM